MIVHLISTMSVVWRKGPREKRRPKSGRTLVTHGRISSPFWFSTIFCKISVFEHTPPLKKINIFDRTHWSRILGFKIGASQGSNWLKTKKSDGPFWRKSWEDFQKIKGSISKKGLIRFFCFSSSQAQEGPNFKAWYMAPVSWSIWSRTPVCWVNLTRQDCLRMETHLLNLEAVVASWHTGWQRQWAIRPLVSFSWLTRPRTGTSLTTDSKRWKTWSWWEKEKHSRMLILFQLIRCDWE